MYDGVKQDLTERCRRHCQAVLPEDFTLSVTAILGRPAPVTRPDALLRITEGNSLFGATQMLK